VGNQIRNKELLVKFGKHLKKLRESKNLSQQELANRCDINTTISTMFLLAEKLNIDVTELVKLK
jgi:transcriptional regulator with XRE-family HTH domain